jgi:ATP dependent DNA ligase domain
MASKQITIRDYNTQLPGALSEDKLSWLFPQINSVNSHGKKTEWRIYVRAYVSTVGPGAVADGTNIQFIPLRTAEYNLLDNKTTHIGGQRVDGWYKVDSRISTSEVRSSVPTYVTAGKNLKSSSATTPVCQALRDAFGHHNKQLKKAVKEAQDEISTVRYPPMLAQKMEIPKVVATLATEPVFVQRKYNGVRVVTALGYVDNDEAQPAVIMYSRRGVTYPGFAYIKEEILHVLCEYWSSGTKIYLDGEIYKHGVALQDISGSARKETSESEVKCDYMVYDCFIPGRELKYSERKALLDEIFDTFEFQYLKQVPTHVVTTMDEINDLYGKFLKEGFEGAMIRFDRPYKYSYNEHYSSILLKMKPTEDAEYEIVRWETGTKGKARGALMIVCKTKAIVKGDVTLPEIEFPVTPAMEIPDRIALATKMSTPDPTPQSPAATYFDTHYKGRPLIVYYDEISNKNVPQRARTKMEIRTWE